MLSRETLTIKPAAPVLVCPKFQQGPGRLDLVFLGRYAECCPATVCRVDVLGWLGFWACVYRIVERINESKLHLYLSPKA